MSEGFPCLVSAQAEARPDAPAVVAPEGVWTWADLDRAVASWVGCLVALAPPGTRVAARAALSPRFVALVLAALRTGHVLAPLSPRLPEAAVREHLAGIACAAWVDPEAHCPPSTVHRPPAVPLDRPAIAVFTSGSMGRPKAALLTAGNLLASAEGVNGAMDLRAGDRWLLDLPLHHVGGLGVVVRCALAGAAVVIPPRAAPKGEALRAYGVTHASLVSTQLYRLLREDGRPLPVLRALLLGGSAIPAGLLDVAHARGLPVATSYGLTEMASTVTATAPGAAPDDLATSGRLLPRRELRVSDGEIEVRGATRFAGYLAGERLEAPFDADGWFATGDLGRLDADGRLVVTGRRDNRFVSGGENVQPEVVEAALLALPGVARAVVVPVPDAEFGARPVAFVEAEDGRAPDGAALGAALRERLPGLLVPVAYHPWPAGEDGLKPVRAALRAEAERRANP